MEGTFHYGDVVLIRKSGYGLETGDLVYLEYPLRDSSMGAQFFLQRILGLPGDSIRISDKRVYKNNVLIQDTSTVQHNYFFKTKRVVDEMYLKARFGITLGGAVSGEGDFGYALSDEQVKQLQADTLIVSLEGRMKKKGTADETCFPYDSDVDWNMDQYGPIYVPKKEDTLRLDSASIRLYQTLIGTFEHNQVEMRNDSIFVNGVPASYYVVKQNYYFVLGDNRDNSNDSRVWGYLPESFIKGKYLSRLRHVKP